MKKYRFSKESAYILGILFMAFSVSLMTKADLGLSMIVSPAYILSQKISFLTFGRAEYCIQLLLVIIICIVTKKVRLSYAFSFVTAIIYGTVLDLFNLMLSNMSVSAMWLRILLFAIGMTVTSFSVSLLFHTYLSPCAYDFFVKKISEEKNLNINKFKLCFDAAFLAISVIMSLLFFKRLVGVSIGTIVIALLNGHIIKFFSGIFDKYLEFYNRFGFNKYFD